MNWWEESALVSDESAGGNWWEESKLASEAPAIQPIEALTTSGLGQEQSAGLMDSIKQAGSNFADSAKRKGLELAAKGIVNHADTTQYLGDRIKDTGLGLVAGSAMAVQAPVGWVSMIDGGVTAKALEDVGFKPGEAIDVLNDLKSEHSKELMQEFQNLEGIWEKLGHVAGNPSIAFDTTVQSAPAMVLGGAVSKGLGAAGLASKTLAGAMGEGMVSAGLQAEGIRGETEDGNLTLKQRGIAAGTGFGVGLFGFGGGRLADKMGIPDVQTLLAGGAAPTVAVVRDASATEASKRIIINGIREGLFEEVPQEVLEQVLENIALNRPWAQGVKDAAVLGFASGTLMGGVVANMQSEAPINPDDPNNTNDSNDPNLPPAGNDNNLLIDDGGIPQQAMDSPSIDDQLMAAVDNFHDDGNDNAASDDIGEPPASAIEIDNTGLPFADELEQQEIEVGNQANSSRQAEEKWNSLTESERYIAAIEELGMTEEEADKIKNSKFEFLVFDVQRSLSTNKPWLDGQSIERGLDLGRPQEESIAEQREEPVTQQEESKAGEVDLFGEPTARDTVTSLETIEVPLDDLQLSDDVPQFKKGANETGEVEPLGGTFDRTGVAPIQVWERLDGRKEVISGRHRLGLARRSGEKTIPAQIHREADGVTREMAATLDAELNIRDGQGSVSDYANYFRNAGIEEQEANARGLLARSKGKAGYAIGAMASDSTFETHQAGRISDTAAQKIAEAAPNNEALQNVALDQLLNRGSSITDAVNTMLAVSTVAGNTPVQDDIFGMDTSAMEAAVKMGREASKKQSEIQQNISAISGASKSPARAKALGVDVKNPKAVQSKLEQLRREKERWDSWATDPELTKQLREAVEPKEAIEEEPPKPQAQTEAAPSNDGAFFGQEESAESNAERKESNAESGFELTTQTEQELAAQEAERKAAEKAEAKAQAEIDKKAAQEAEKKAVKANNEAANAEFALGQDAEENIGGQRNILDAINNAAQEADTSPTEAQKEAGNYKKGHVSIQGLDVSIENPKGSTRSGTDTNGKAWSVKMKSHYGYIKKTEGADGDHVDVFIGDHPESERVYVVDQ